MPLTPIGLLLLAAPVGTSSAAATLPAVVVTAARSPRTAFDLDRTVHTLDAGQMHRRQVQTLPDALHETPGVYVQATNRGAGAPILRGLIGPENLITVDGVRFNNGTFRTGPNQYFAVLDPSVVETLEVMPGPGSVLYGSDAMGGVLQVMPVRPWQHQRPVSVRGGVAFASADLSTSTWLSVSARHGPVAARVGGAFRRFGELTAGEGVHQPNSDFTQASLHLVAEYHLTRHDQLRLTWLHGQIDDAGRVDRLYTGRFRFYDNQDDLGFVEYRHAGARDDVLQGVRAALSLHRTDEVANLFRCDLGQAGAEACFALQDPVMDGATPTAPLTRHDRTRDQVLTPGLLVQAELQPVTRLRLVAGGEVYADSVDSEAGRRDAGEAELDPADRGNFSEGSSYRSAGAYLYGEYALWQRRGHHLSVTGGARLSAVAARADDVPGIGEVRYDFVGAVGSAGLVYRLRRQAALYASFAQGFRAPNLQETTVLGDTGSKIEVPNADLGPYHSDTVELGARFDPGPVAVRLSAFTSWLDDTIDERALSEDEIRALGLTPGDKPVVQRVNADGGRYVGGEVQVELDPVGPGFVPYASATYTRGEIDTDAGPVPARRVPPLNGALGLRLEPEEAPWFVEVYGLFALRQDRLHPSDLSDFRICEDPANRGDLLPASECSGTAGWATVNVRAGYALADSLRLDLAGQNLADRRYKRHGSGFDAPGRGLAATLTAQY